MTRQQGGFMRVPGMGLTLIGLSVLVIAQSAPVGTALLLRDGRCFIRNTSTGTERTMLQSGSGDKARFSPDGRQIVVPYGDALRLYRNDGTSFRNLSTRPAPAPGDGLAWTTAGFIYWTANRGTRFYRINVQSGAVDSLPFVFGNGGIGQITFSMDGRRAVGYWEGNPDPGAWGTSKIDVFDLVTGGARIIAAPCGPTISASGNLFAQTFVDHMSIHASIIDSMPTLSQPLEREKYFCKTITFPHNITDPRWSSFSDDWMVGIGWNNNVIAWTWVIDYKNGVVYDIGAAPATVSDFRPGVLPDPGVVSDPVLSVNPVSLRFTAVSASSAVTSQSVTVTNAGGGTLAKVTASSNAGWLVPAVQGSGGNTQTITNTISMNGMATGTYGAIVSVSGGGAPNPAQYSATLIIGTSLPAPTAVTARSLGGPLVALSWQDNATDETGYAIERRPQTGIWAEVKRTAVNVASWTDSGLAGGVTYSYRLRTVRSTLNSVEFSTYSDSVSVGVPNYPVITLTAPAAGDRWIAGSTVFVKWTAVNIASVGLKISYDDGVDWQAIVPSGGVRGSIKPTDPDWGNCQLVVPDSVSDAVMVQAYAYDQPAFGATSGRFSIVTSSAAQVRSPQVAKRGAFGPKTMLILGDRVFPVDYRKTMRAGGEAMFRIDGSRIHGSARGRSGSIIMIRRIQE